MTISHNIIEHAKRMYPKGISYKGNLTDKQIQSIQEKCDIDWNILANGEKRYTIFYRGMTKEQAIKKIQAIIDCDLRELNTMPQHETLRNEVEALDMAIKALEQQPSEGKVSVEVYKQVMSERDIAIEQLRELGYEFGEKIRTSDDCVSRSEIINELNRLGRNAFKDDTDYDNFFAFVDSLPPVTPTFPKNATNGDMIKAMFPNIEADEIKTDTGGYIEVKYLDTTEKCDATAFRKNWWNAPYRKD